MGELFKELEPEDLLKFGLIPEFVGRLPVIATLTDLDEAALVTILTEPKNALVKQYQRLFEIEGVKLTFTAGRPDRHRQARDQAQDRRARPAVDHGGYPSGHHVRTARHGRRRRSRGQGRGGDIGRQADAGLHRDQEERAGEGLIVFPGMYDAGRAFGSAFFVCGIGMSRRTRPAASP